MSICKSLLPACVVSAALAALTHANVTPLVNIPLPQTHVTWDHVEADISDPGDPEIEHVRSTSITARWTSSSNYRSVTQTFVWDAVRKHETYSRLSVLGSIPFGDESVGWSQSNATHSVNSGGTSARWTNESTFRSAVQSFTLEQDGYVTGVGFVVAPNQNSVAGTHFTRNQAYELDLQQLSSAGSGSQSVVGTVFNEVFTLPVSYVSAGNVIYLEFAKPVYLTAGAYGFNLRPQEIKGGNVLMVATSAADVDPVTSASGGQNQTPGQLGVGVNYHLSSNDFDYLFFITNVSPNEPLTSVGITIADNQNSGSGLMYSVSQEYAIDVYAIDDAGSTSPTITSLLATQTFELDPADVKPGFTLQVELDTPLSLTRGGSYGFNLRPTEIVGGNALAVAVSEAGYHDDTYASGYGSQTSQGHPLSGAFPVTGSHLNLLFNLGNQPSLISRVRYASPGATETYFTYPHTNGFWPDSDHAILMEGAHPNYGKVVQWDLENDTRVTLHDFGAPVKAYYSVSGNGKLITTIRNRLEMVDLTVSVGYETKLQTTVYDEGNFQPDPSKPGYNPWSLTDVPDITYDGYFAVIYLGNTIDDEYAIQVLETDSLNATTLELDFTSIYSHVHFSPYNENYLSFGHKGEMDSHPSEQLARLFAHNDAVSSQPFNYFDQLGAAGNYYWLGHERAVFHKEADIVVAYRGSPAGAGLIMADYDGDAEMVSSSNRYWHVNISHDGNWAIVDSIPYAGRNLTDIYLVDLSTGQSIFLYRTSRDAVNGHPWHPHPHFSPDGDWVIFNDFYQQAPIAIELSSL